MKGHGGFRDHPQPANSSGSILQVSGDQDVDASEKSRDNIEYSLVDRYSEGIKDEETYQYLICLRTSCRMSLLIPSVASQD
jgi:hypothetical protein